MKESLENKLSIVIPSYNEVSVLPTLESVRQSSSPDFPVLVYVVVNGPSNAPENIRIRNQKAFDEIEIWKSLNETQYFQIKVRLFSELDPSKAGVGLARKIGMDEAANDFRKHGVNGVIANLDADCFVSGNYISQVATFFKINPEVSGCSIYFEHRLDNDNRDLHDAIKQYEIHLRYYKQCISYIGMPHAYHTVGSSMAVRSDIYLKSGGMNTRKAGEDFYFLQKIFSQYNFGELNTTIVYPLGRVSNRVPFGTGAAMNKFLQGDKQELQTYSLASFDLIRLFLMDLFAMEIKEQWRDFFVNESQHSELRKYLEEEGFFKALDGLIDNSKDIYQLKNQFFRFFNNFRLLKCLNYLRDNKFPDSPVLIEANLLLKALCKKEGRGLDETLDIYRNLDKLA